MRYFTALRVIKSASRIFLFFIHFFLFLPSIFYKQTPSHFFSIKKSGFSYLCHSCLVLTGKIDKNRGISIQKRSFGSKLKRITLAFLQNKHHLLMFIFDPTARANQKRNNARVELCSIFTAVEPRLAT